MFNLNNQYPQFSQWLSNFVLSCNNENLLQDFIKNTPFFFGANDICQCVATLVFEWIQKAQTHLHARLMQLGNNFI
jgi:hypothetical protein